VLTYPPYPSARAANMAATGGEWPHERAGTT
jgi:hypothetical protein